MAKNRFTDAASEASDLTNSELADQIVATTKLDQDTIDKDAFAKLMEQVEADTTMDEKLAFLQDNIQTVGAVALNLLKVLV